MRRPGAEAGRKASGTVLALAAIVGVLALPLSGVAAETDGEAAAGTATITGPAEVVDGDGLKIGPVAIRIHGIDAPEAAQDCPKASGGNGPAAKAATALLDDLAGGREVACTARDRDGYGRIVASCAVDGQDVASAIMRAGLAWAYVEYSTDYVDLEAAAKAEGVGVWQAPAQPPWEYRADRWERAVAEAPGGCPIKGNIARDGERIYHTPWSPWYGRTKISEGKGERWFCDEGAAQAAGWRAAEK